MHGRFRALFIALNNSMFTLQNLILHMHARTTNLLYVCKQVKL